MRLGPQLLLVLAALGCGVSLSLRDGAQAGAGLASDAPFPDEIESLPGAPGGEAPWARISSGYVTVNKKRGKKLFYALVHARSEPESAPLILWLQGGPGCSSIGAGFWTELGPYTISRGSPGSGEVLEPNPWTWAQAANVVFLESPVFVGFSTSGSNEDRSSNDDLATRDHVSFLRHLLQRHPYLGSRQIYLAGESYAGHYLPLLATQLLYDAKHLHPEEQLLPSGIIVGNPWTSPLHDNTGAMEFWYGQGLISRACHEGLANSCQLSKGALWRTEGPNGLTSSCNAWRDRAYREMGGINLYALGAPVCMAAEGATEFPPGAPYAGNPVYDPCSRRRVAAYMNRVDVQQAMHAVEQGQGPVRWQQCVGQKDGFNYPASSLSAPVMHLYPRLLEAGVSVMVLSGADDGVVPTLGTRSWVEAAGLREVQQHTPWLNEATGQVGGYVVSYAASISSSAPGGAASTNEALGRRAGTGAGPASISSSAPGTSTPEGAASTNEALGRKAGPGTGPGMGPGTGSTGSSSEEGSRRAALDLDRRAGQGQDTGSIGLTEQSRTKRAGPSGPFSSSSSSFTSSSSSSSLQSSGLLQRDKTASPGVLHLVVVQQAGHSVPTFQPAAALQLLSAFLDGRPLSNLSSSTGHA